MNEAEKVLFELRVDMAREPDGVEDAELDYLLASITNESDASLTASCKLLGLDAEVVEEKAGRLEFDEGLPRVKANRLAVLFALREVNPTANCRAARWLFHDAATILEWQANKTCTREQTVAAILECIASQSAQREDCRCVA